MKKICIDPGHPSYFKGTKKINWGAEVAGVKEVKLNLQLAKILQKLLDKEGFQTILTRTNNHTPVSNKQRAQIAKDFQANLFLHLHADFERHHDPDVQGFKTIYPPPSVKLIHNTSWTIAQAIHQSVIPATPFVDRGVCDERICKLSNHQGLLTGTHWANKYKIPTVLLEVGYLSNPHDRTWLTTPKNQQLLISAVTQGITNYFA